MLFSSDTSKKKGLITVLGKAFLIISLILLITYQLYIVIHTNQKLPFLEPDNYEYYLFAQLAISHNTLNVSNPYIVISSLSNGKSSFFESPGLYQAPVILHWIIPVIPLVWDFRIIYLIAILLVYSFTFLIARKVIHNYLVLKGYEYFSYSLIFVSFILMQQSQIIEWRGTLFIVAFQLAIVYLLSYIYTTKSNIYDVIPNKKRNLYIATLLIPLLLFLSWYFWSGWFVNLVTTILLSIFLYIYYISKKVGNLSNILYKIIVILLIFFPFLILFFNNYFIAFSINTISHFYFMPSCLTNPLNLSEVACLNSSNGLFVVALDLFFGCFIILAFFLDKFIGSFKRKYEYFIISSIIMILIQLPLVAGYVRLVQLIAPYLTVLFSVGTVSLFIRSGSRRIVNILVMFMIFISSAFGLIVYTNSLSELYTLNNPIGLYNIASILQQNSPNSTVFSFYGYGDVLEQVGHVKVYSDTIQALNPSVIEPQDAIFLDNVSVACSSIKNEFPSNYVLVSPLLDNFTIFSNATNKSIIKDPLSLNTCGYTLVNTNQSFYLFKVN